MSGSQGTDQQITSAWTPQPGPQLAAIDAREFIEELCYGGAKYGGKSDLLLGDYLIDVPTYRENWHGILFRMQLTDLEDLIRRSHEFYPQAGGVWQEQKKTWTFPDYGGATLRMRYLARLADYKRYHGWSLTWIGFDELTEWLDLDHWKLMRTCLRWANAPVPTKRMRASCNPGGPGHHAVAQYFNIEDNPKGYTPYYDEVVGHYRMFIPSRYGDNKKGLEADPGYVGRLKGAGSPQLVKAWLEGDWSVVQGAFFPELRRDRHVIRPIRLPDHWTRFCAFDWGSYSPFCVLHIAVASENLGRIPRGALVVYREWYGADKDRKGLKMRNEDIAQGILDREHEQIDYRVADPSIFKEEGGPSIEYTFRKNGVAFSRGDNDRISGWGEIRSRIAAETELPNYDPQPMLFFFDTCVHTYRTLSTVQHDEKKPEDVDSDGEDHAPDALRYGCKSWPFESKAPTIQEPMRGIERATLNELLQIHDGRNGVRRDRL